jgi:hypothetical protein
MPASGPAFGASKIEYFIAPQFGGRVTHVEGTVVSEITTPATTIDVLGTASDRAIYIWEPATRTIAIVPRSKIRLPTSGL